MRHKMKLVFLLVLIRVAISISKEIKGGADGEAGGVGAGHMPPNVEIPNWESPNITVENVQIIREREESEQNLINNVAYRGSPVKNYQIGLRQMNLLMRENYNDMIQRVGRNVYPLIVATDVHAHRKLSGIGSEYILFLQNGTVHHMTPTPAEYEQNKNLAHLAMSIFTIISPFFKDPTSPMWHDKLRTLQNVISNNLDALNSSIIHSGPGKWTAHIFCDNNLGVEDHKTMLTLAYNYISDCFKRNSADVENYKKFTASYLPYIEKALKCASQIQAKAAMIELKKWKNSLGPKLWREVYVLIPVIWPVARLNPRQQIFEQLMDKDRVATHILKTEGVQSIDEARVLAGRIIADRTMAHFVFGYQNRNHTELNLALSTRRDLVASNTLAYFEERNQTKPHKKVEIHIGGGSSILGNKTEIEVETTAEPEPETEVEPNNIHFQLDYD